MTLQAEQLEAVVFRGVTCERAKEGGWKWHARWSDGLQVNGLSDEITFEAVGRLSSLMGKPLPLEDALKLLNAKTFETHYGYR